jgi:hypothetical protein
MASDAAVPSEAAFFFRPSSSVMTSSSFGQFRLPEIEIQLETHQQEEQ